MSYGERWFLLILVKLLTITQWVKVRGDFCWYWWNCWPSVNELNRGVNFVDIGGGIVVHHLMSCGERWLLLILVELLTITQWVMVRGDFCWYWWWSTIPPISTKITFHLNSFSDGKQFHQYQQKSPLTSTHWVMSIITPISTKITPHFNSLNDGQQFHQYQQKSPLTSTHWVMVNNSTNISKHHLSPNQIDWWSTIPPISTKITSHLHSLSDGQQFHQYQITSHLNSLSDGQQFHQYQKKSPFV